MGGEWERTPGKSVHKKQILQLFTVYSYTDESKDEEDSVGIGIYTSTECKYCEKIRHIWSAVSLHSRDDGYYCRVVVGGGSKTKLEYCVDAVAALYSI